MKKYGNSQRRFGETAPQAYDKATRKVCMDIEPCMIANQHKNDENDPDEIEGFSWVEVYLGEGSLDYGAVKSKLIENAYSPKDEFGVLMNAVSAIVGMLTDEQKEHEDIKAFMNVDEWRGKCAEAAKAVCIEVGTLLLEEETQRRSPNLFMGSFPEGGRGEFP